MGGGSQAGRKGEREEGRETVARKGGIEGGRERREGHKREGVRIISSNSGISYSYSQFAPSSERSTVFTGQFCARAPRAISK